jgi:hypothetical protein
MTILVSFFILDKYLLKILGGSLSYEGWKGHSTIL